MNAFKILAAVGLLAAGAMAGADNGARKMGLAALAARYDSACPAAVTITVTTVPNWCITGATPLPTGTPPAETTPAPSLSSSVPGVSIGPTESPAPPAASSSGEVPLAAPGSSTEVPSPPAGATPTASETAPAATTSPAPSGAPSETPSGSATKSSESVNPTSTGSHSTTPASHTGPATSSTPTTYTTSGATAKLCSTAMVGMAMAFVVFTLF